MIEGKYSITMKTPLGTQKGVVTLNVQGDSLSGSFKAMGTANSFSNGKVSGNKITFSGTLRTIIGSIPYVVEATIEGDNITGVAKTSKGNFQIDGKRV